MYVQVQGDFRVSKGPLQSHYLTRILHNALFLGPKICVSRGASVVWKYECSQLEIFYFWSPGSSIFTFNHMYSILQYRINIAQFFWDLFFSAFVPDTKKFEHFLLIRTKRISKLSSNFGCLFTFLLLRIYLWTLCRVIVTQRFSSITWVSQCMFVCESNSKENRLLCLLQKTSKSYAKQSKK